MCTHRISSKLRGISLEHGAAHSADHRHWSRRDFLYRMGAAALGTGITLGGTTVRTYGSPSLLKHLQALETDRVLVLIQLSGGNDGLNTVVPVTNDRYYQNRPRLAVSPADVMPLSDDLGLHPSMLDLEALWGDGRMAVVQGVGYPEPDLSHFRSTDIWVTGSDSDVYETTGWAGRYLDRDFPDFSETPPDFPPAVQIGSSQALLFQGPTSNMGMTLANVALFEQLAAGDTIYDENNVPATKFGAEMSFVRSVANDSFQYANAIEAAANGSENRVDYPTGNNRLAENLAVVARLIKGNLGTRIYLVSLGGFDTHANQTNQHANLLRNISTAVHAFQQDLAADGYDDRVMTMTFSEFGRRVEENGSNGTDHGTAAPVFVFGTGVAGGLYGMHPDLDDLDQAGNMKYTTDFRSVYATILSNWFGIETDLVASIFGDSFESLNFVADPTATSGRSESIPTAFALHQNYPNPFNPRTLISYSLDTATHVDLSIFDLQGRRIETLVRDTQAPGTYRVTFDASNRPNGVYLYRLTTEQGTRTRKMTLLR